MFAANLLKGRRILVTGGGTGLGKGMTEAFLKLGAEVHICSRRKAVSLNEAELREQLSKEDADKAAKLDDLLPPDPPADGKPYKFARTFLNNEALQIAEDFVQGKRLLEK